MKQLYIGRAIFIALFFLQSYSSFGQSPTGATINNPINWGTLSPGITPSDTKNNSTSNGFLNNMGQQSDDIYYKFTLSVSAEVSISHCASTIDTYMYLLSSTGTIIDQNDDWGPLCPTSMSASIKRTLSAGTYYVVSEGYYTTTGNITTTISIPSSIIVNTEYADQMNQIFASLETNRVPYGLLLDIGMEKASLSNFSGASLVDSNYVGSAEFEAIYTTLASCRVNTNSPIFNPMNTIKKTSFSQRQARRILLSGLFYKYSKFTDNAVQNNQITVSNNKIYDKYTSGVWQNPYEVKTVFAINPTLNKYVGKNQNLFLPSSLWFSNDLGSVSSIQIDAGDGLGYRNVVLGQSVAVTYPTIGKKQINYKLNLSNSTSLYSHSTIEIEPSVHEVLPNVQIIPVQASESFEGITARATMTIQYANPALGLRNPFIVAEGYDTGLSEAPEDEFGDMGIVQFRDQVRRSPELQQLLLDNPQFDIVYVDWNDGTDNIKRNALVLKQVIREVNSRKAQAGSSQANVVIGQSMGGLVARWALKDMENKNENHQTRLFITHDTPHQGANVPLGFQYLARHFRKLYHRVPIVSSGLEILAAIGQGTSPDDVLTLADRPASRQMLINYVDVNYQIDNTVHNQWQNELKAMGYPLGVPNLPFKKVAISNGAQCATGQLDQIGGTLLPPGGSLLSFYGKANTSFLGDLSGMIAAPFISTYLTSSPALLGMLPGRNEFKAELQVNSNTTSGNRVYYNKITYTKRVLWLIPITVNIANESFNAPTGMLTYDSYPGGFFDVPMNLNELTSSDKTWAYKYNVTASNAKLFTFVPITSALDIGGGNVTLAQADYQTKYTAASPPAAPKNSPFSKFLTGIANTGLNESHITFTAENGRWLAAELPVTGNAPALDCTFFCTPNLISGPEAYCTNTTYSINGFPSSSSWGIVWSTTGNISITGSTTGTSVNVSGTYGSGVISARITSPCSTTGTTISKSVIFNYLTGSTTYDRTPQSSGYQYFTCTMTQIPGTVPSNYSWFKEESNGSLTQIGGGGIQLNNYPIPPCSAVYFRCVANTPCGTQTFRSYAYNTTCNQTMTTQSSSFSTFPNPTNNQLIVRSLETSTNESAIQEDFEVALFDQKGKKLAGARNDKMKEVLLDTSNIPNGTYFLHISKGKEIEKKQIIITH